MLKKMIVLAVALITLSSTTLSWAAPKIESWTTANGLRVYYVAAPELPMVDLSLVFDAGSARDGSKQGLSMLTNSMLNKGAAGLSEDQIAEQFESIGANIATGTSMDNASVGLRTITMDK